MKSKYLVIATDAADNTRVISSHLDHEYSDAVKSHDAAIENNSDEVISIINYSFSVFS